MSGFSHIDEGGRARMVDVGEKSPTRRRARAETSVVMNPETLDALAEQRVPKGDVIAAARLAGIMAAKQTPDLIPLCHHVAVTSVAVDLVADPLLPGLRVTAEASALDRTGVEMEAMTAAAVAALTVYDMCKAIDKHMEITGLRLLEKHGGRSGDWNRASDANAADGAGEDL
jgi:cyclic pyranopterin phosphate synthase